MGLRAFGFRGFSYERELKGSGFKDLKGCGFRELKRSRAEPVSAFLSTASRQSRLRV